MKLLAFSAGIALVLKDNRAYHMDEHFGRGKTFYPPLSLILCSVQMQT
jgi:hypothetical protein